MADDASNSEELPAASDQASTQAVETPAPEQSEETETTATATETEHSEQSADVGDQQTDEQATTGSDEEEGTFFDPKKVPPELMPAYKQMQADYVRKTQALKAREKELVEQGATKEEAKDQAQAETKASLVDTVLKARGIDPSKLPKEQREALELVADVAQAAADGRVTEAVTPLYADKTKGEIDGYFKANPEALKFRAKMAEIDRRTGEKLTLKELHTLAASGETTNRAKEELSSKAEARRLNNSEGSASTASGAPSGKDPFKNMLEQSASQPGRF